MLLTAVAIVPIMGALALGVDYAEMSRQRQATLHALDAAGLATARRIIEGASDSEAIAYANDFFLANLNNVVDPHNASLHVTLPQDNSGGGTLKLEADLNYQPYFLSTFSSLMGDGQNQVDFNATSEIRLKDTLEVALVLDNSGSMDYYGSGSGKKRIDLLKSAAKELVSTLANQAGLMKQVSKPVQFGLVPFAASVNVGPQYADASWMDTEGRSPIHHENFDWGAFTSSNKKVQLDGGVYRKKGSDWGDEENDIVTRFSLFDEMKRITGSQWVSNGNGKYVCTSYYWGSCHKWEWQSSGYYQDTYASYASWQGCVETRPYPYANTDATPTASDPATLFVPMFAPDETDNRDGSRRYASDNYWPDLTTSSNDATRQAYMPKYFEPAPQGTSAAGDGQGPNASCTTQPITPLQDVTTTAGMQTIDDAIDAMEPNGATNVPQGMGWGWRVVSSAEPFTEGRPETERGNEKVIIVLTDGANTYYTPSSLGYNDLAGNNSTYSSYGYTKVDQSGESTTRMFMGTNVNKSSFSNDNYTAAMTEQMSAVCENAKAAGVIVMTVSLDLSSSNADERDQMAALKACASDSRFRKDPDDPSQAAKLYWNATGATLSDDFKEIADELSNLRIVG